VTVSALERNRAAGASSLQVREDLPAAAWDEYVQSHPDASAYHRHGWVELIGRAFGHEIRPLACTDGDAITGVLPLVVMRSRLFGTFVVSLPFLNAGGVLADDRGGADLLLESATAIARARKADYLELRHTARHFPALHERRHRVAMSVGLAASSEQQWLALDRKVRNQVRKAEKHNLAPIVGGLELVPHFYAVFGRNMRDLGTPVFPHALFQQVLQTFPDNSRVICVCRGEQPVAAAIVHWRNGWMEVPWASTLREFNSMAANMLLYWHMLRLAIEQGCSRFEFGRCAPGEGTFHFKKQWGAEPTPLVWEYWMRGGKPARFDPHSGDSSYGRAAALWKYLPLPVSNLIGPRIVRGIPC
jgi:FemAB-related protein (PEP-CTERM system-associated)